MLHLLPQHEPEARPRLMPRRCRGWRASATRCGWSTAVRRRARRRPRRDEVAAAWPEAGEARHRCFDRRSARLVGAAAAGSRPCSASGRRAASRTAPRARRWSPRSAASFATSPGSSSPRPDQRLRGRRVGAPFAPAAVVKLASSLPSRCAAKIRLLAVTPEPQLATNGRAGSIPASANSRRNSSSGLKVPSSR